MKTSCHHSCSAWLQAVTDNTRDTQHKLQRAVGRWCLSYISSAWGQCKRKCVYVRLSTYLYANLIVSVLHAFILSLGQQSVGRTRYQVEVDCIFSWPYIQPNYIHAFQQITGQKKPSKINDGHQDMHVFCFYGWIGENSQFLNECPSVLTSCVPCVFYQGTAYASYSVWSNITQYSQWYTFSSNDTTSVQPQFRHMSTPLLWE